MISARQKAVNIFKFWGILNLIYAFDITRILCIQKSEIHSRYHTVTQKMYSWSYHSLNVAFQRRGFLRPLQKPGYVLSTHN